MKQHRVGKTGLFVGSIGLGTMTWGRDTDKHEAAEQLHMLLDHGGNVIDTSPSFGHGASEEIVGELCADVSRDDIVLTTKAGISTRSDGSNVIDCSRRAMLKNLDTSLQRLRTDYIDVWLLQRFDPHIRVEETLSALVYALRSGRVRYVGASNYPAWALAQLAELLRHEGYELAVGEYEYSLLERGIEREVIPALGAYGAGLFSWSPAGRGVLTGKYRSTTPPDSRAASPHLADFVSPYLTPEYSGIVEAVCAAADGLEQTPIDVAMAWVRAQPHMACALSGARSAQQLKGIIDSDELMLPHQIAVALSDVSKPLVTYPETASFV